MSSAEVQIWNNAAFDDGNSEDLTSNRHSWGSLKSIFDDPKASFDSESGKENQGSFLDNQISSSSSIVSSSTTAFKPVNRDGLQEKSRNNNGVLKRNSVNKIGDERKIDKEIEEIENEIGRLSSRLEALRLEKMEMNVRVSEKRVRVVPAKFMEQKPCVKNANPSKVQRRGVSLGPSEIASRVRRPGMSMGPSEILGPEKVKRIGKQDVFTPVQSRRKSCFWKLDEIAEEKEVCRDEMGIKGSSLSPKSRKPQVVLPRRQAMTTIGSKKVVVKKEDGIIQPKKLFKDGEHQLVAANSTVKKPLRPGRVVASRYNQNTGGQASAARKRLLPEEEEEDNNKRCEKKRSLSMGKSCESRSETTKYLGTETRVKKQWEIPSEIVVHSSNEEEEDEKSPKYIVIVGDLLPKIRIARCMNEIETPRDSGPAKRVAELIEKKSYFCDDEEMKSSSICQVLNYADEEEKYQER